MSKRGFLKEHLFSIAVMGLAVATVEIFLMTQNIPLMISLYLAAAVLGAYAFLLGAEYIKKRNYYKELLENLEGLNQKYLLASMIKEAEFLEGKLLYEVLKDLEKSMLDHVNEYKHANEEYKDYIEMWIHEIKLPIATSKMIAENNPSPITKSMDEELEKIDGYVEQALYYARSYNVEKDYVIKKILVKDVVSQVLIKNKKICISRRIPIHLHDLEMEVHSDSKWLVFILNQILGNSIKYMKETDPGIEIYCQQKKEQVTLHIRDQGIGILPEDLPRVFEKGFTGSMNRGEGKSTGIGLYLCKKLCGRLGHGISIQSVPDWGTEVTITFPKGSFFGTLQNC